MKIKLTILCLLTASIGGVAIADPAEADKTLAPYFLVDSPHDPEATGLESFPLQSTHVTAKISGIIAKVEVRQVYQNRGNEAIEAIYLFPGSTRAAIHGLTMKIEDRTIEAKIKEKSKARQSYEKAKTEGKTASLLEQHRPNVFQMNVANILPGDTVEAVLQYTEYLKPEEKVYSFVFPTVVGPRYAGDSQGEQHQWVANPFLQEGSPDPTTFDLKVMLDAGMPIQDLACETHQADIQYLEASRASIELIGNRAGTGNRDFILNYRLADRTISSGLLLHEGNEGEENFFLLTVQPPERVTPEIIPPRDYIFMVDVSGSMGGFPLNTAKTLVQELVGNLEPTDTFNLLTFAGGSTQFSEKPVPATAANLNTAIRWMNSHQSGGGTELISALKRAINLPGDDTISRSVVVITDGYISFERKAFEVVERNLGQANLFAFGIGSSVNRYLIEGMARVGRGEPFVVTDPKFASERARKLKDYISAPVLTNVAVNFKDFDAYDVEPATMPDILADRPLTVFGKWRGKPGGAIEVTGSNGGGKFARESAVDSPDSTQPALPYLWARDRIARLSDYQGGGRSDPELEKRITNLGLTYNLITRYTSFVAIDDVVRKSPGDPAKTVKQPLPLPSGVPASAVGGGSTPGPGIIPLLIASLAALFGKRFLRKNAA